MFKRAIIRGISPNYKSCISSHPSHNKLNLEKALLQHKRYKETLKELGLDVIELEADENFPDCCFVEDTAIIHNRMAVISRMKPLSRRNETEAVKTILKEYFSIHQIIKPGYIEGGDVIHFDQQLISGLSKRTNLDGIKQAEKLLNVKINSINTPDIIHLKSYISELDSHTILCPKKYFNESILKDFVKIIVPESESYAANVLEVNGTIIMPQHFEKTRTLLINNGYEIIELDTSEFQKCEGSLTCLSLLF